MKVSRNNVKDIMMAYRLEPGAKTWEAKTAPRLLTGGKISAEEGLALALEIGVPVSREVRRAAAAMARQERKRAGK